MNKAFCTTTVIVPICVTLLTAANPVIAPCEAPRYLRDMPDNDPALPPQDQHYERTANIALDDVQVILYQAPLGSAK